MPRHTVDVHLNRMSGTRPYRRNSVGPRAIACARGFYVAVHAWKIPTLRTDVKTAPSVLTEFYFVWPWELL